jgi:hypothetical protein
MKLNFKNYFTDKKWFTLEFLPRVCLYVDGDKVSTAHCIEVCWLFWAIEYWWWTYKK